MNIRINVIIKLFLLPLIMSVIVTRANTAIIEVGDGKEYSCIQDAVNNANEGDKIIVHSGIYEENVIVNKQLTLQGMGTPVIDAKGFGNSINLYAGNSVVDGFVLCNGRSGLYMVSNDNVIKNNTIKENQYGIYLFKSGENVIEQNLIDDNRRYGLYLLIKSNNNVISGNIVNKNEGGIRIIASDDNQIFLNSIVNNPVVSNGDIQWDNGIDKCNYYSFFDERSEGFIDTADYTLGCLLQDTGKR